MQCYELNRNQCLAALKIGGTKWDAQRNFDYEYKMVGKKKIYLIPVEDVINFNIVKDLLPIETNPEGNQILQQLESNVDFTQQSMDASELVKKNREVNIQFKKAQINKIAQQIKILEQRLVKKKRDIFNQWSKQFFTSFSQHFIKLKNTIIQLHLSQDQVDKFNNMMDSCIGAMQVDLDNIWERFKQEHQEVDDEY